MDSAVTRMCRCSAWAPNVSKIDSVFTLHTMRTGWQYDGEQFKFCPWCGNELLFVPLTMGDLVIMSGNEIG